jgi:hypothetical protein
VIEGAGSVSELNLRQHDLVNLGLVTRLDAPWVLVADIERGGVFASVIGTVSLLEPEERRLFRGFLINKFFEATENALRGRGRSCSSRRPARHVWARVRRRRSAWMPKTAWRSTPRAERARHLARASRSCASLRVSTRQISVS